MLQRDMKIKIRCSSYGFIKGIFDCCGGALLVSLLLMSSHTYGQLTQNLSIGNPKALALGNAVTADPPGIDSIHFNPAGIAKLSGRRRQMKLMVAAMDIYSKTGAQQNSQAVKDKYADRHGEPYPVDDQANLEGSSTGPIIMLPFFGMTETPVMIAPFGGISVQDEAFSYTPLPLPPKVKV